MPAAGHMVHMPSHIYQRVGRYADAVHATIWRSLADEDYITQCRAQGMYPMAYYPHNVHFLWWSATFDGQSARAHRRGAQGRGRHHRCDAAETCRCSRASA